ncbi:MAG TPA: hypothetical protein VHJ17_16840 [Thermomonospora sp.]|nr:hypothetical protein [Thermomonospora sp.]
MTPVSAEWARWAAVPGDGPEVRAWSEGTLRAPHFARIVTRFSPGLPEDDDALPRVTVGAMDISRVAHIAVVLETAEQDDTGRQAVSGKVFVLRYEALAAARAGYRALYEGLSAVDLPESGTAPTVSVAPTALDPGTLGGDLRRLGGGVAWASALLVRNRQVCVTHAETVGLDDRLRYIDAVAAQLPFGYRAKLTTTTWASSDIRHPLRLYFARSSESGAVMVRWRGPVPADADPDVVRGHLGPLRDAVDRHGPVEVVRLLAADIVPRTCDDPGPAVEALRALAGPAEPPPPAEPPVESLGLDGLRELFAGDPAPVEELDPVTARRLLARLVELAEPDDWPVIEEWWPVLAEDDGAALLRPMLERCRALLWSGERVRLHAQLLVAYRHDRGDEFLAMLVTPPHGSPEEYEPGLSAAAQLVHDSVIATGATGSHPRTLDSVLTHPPVLCAVVAQLAVTGPEALRDGLGWLGSDPRAGERVEALATLLTGADPRPLPAEGLRRLASYGWSCVASLLEATCAVGRLPLVLRAFVELLFESGEVPPDARRYWANRLSGLRPADPVVSGAVDVLLLVFGGRPDVPRRLAQDADGAYRRGFVRTWRLPWPDRQGPQPGLAALIRAQHGLLDAEASRALRALADELDDDLPEVVVSAPRPVRLFAEDDTGDSVLDHLVSGYRRGLTPELCVRRLVTRPWRPSAAEAADVVRGLVPALTSHDVPAAGAHRWVGVLVEHLLAGAFGDHLPEAFRDAVLTGIAEDLQARLALLRAVSGGAPVPSSHAAEFHQIRRDLRDLLTTAPPPMWPRPPRRR